MRPGPGEGVFLNQLGNWNPIAELCQEPIEVCGHKIKVGPRQGAIGPGGGTKQQGGLRRNCDDGPHTWTVVFLVTQKGILIKREERLSTGSGIVGSLCYLYFPVFY